MKLQHLFESNAETEILDWMVKSILMKYAIYGGENQSEWDKRYEMFEKSGLAPYEFFKQSPNGTFDKEEVKFIMDSKIIGNEVYCEHAILRSLDKIGPPPFKFKKVDHVFSITDCKTLQQAEPWFPEEAKIIKISNCPNFSVSGIDKHVKKCNEFGVIGDDAQGGVLGLLNIKGLSFVRLDIPSDTKKSKTLNDILFRYLENSDEYEGGDIMDCQSELLDAGLKEFAKL